MREQGRAPLKHTKQQRGGGRTLWVLSACLVVMGVALILGVGTGCKNEVRQGPQSRPLVVRDVPEVLRGTIGSECSIEGTEPQLVSGLGVVVGLTGTGGGNYPVAVQETMEMEVARNGITRAFSFTPGDPVGMSPREFLRDKSVAVVVVEAAIPPGAPNGTRFDVFVRAIPGTGVESLEGGRLYTTELRIGPATTKGGVKQRKLAEAKGEVYINPYVEPRQPGEVGVSRTTGRVLNGGVVTNALRLNLVLDNESHARAVAIRDAINSRFPPGPGDRGDTATGRDGESIAIRVPRRYADRPGEFLQLLRYTRIDQRFGEEWARRYVVAMREQPWLAEELGWCLRALGEVSRPFLAELYDYPELAPRVEALKAGAALEDPRVVEPLKRLAYTGPAGERLQAIELLARMPSNVRASLALRELLDAPDLDVRVAAYEGLSDRRDPIVRRRLVQDSGRVKFVIERVPSTSPMVYVTQQGEPRVVLFGDPIVSRVSDLDLESRRLRIEPDALVVAWNGRFMMDAGGQPTGSVRLFYEDPRRSQPVRESASDKAEELVEFLARGAGPDEVSPGLDMTYSQVVGLLYEMQSQGAIPGVFATEEDTLRMAVFQAGERGRVEDRPERPGELPDTAEESPQELVYEPLGPVGGFRDEDESKEQDRVYVVPLERRKPEQEE